MKKNDVFGHYINNAWRKTYRVMKLTVLFLMLGIISVSAKGFAQGGTISLRMENASLEDILQELKSHSDYTFVYSDQHIEDVNHESFEVNDANLEVVMQECLEGTDLDYYTENDVVVIFKKDPVLEQPAQQQQYEIKGTVVDEENIPLPGVSVVVKGTNIGTATDIDGRYVIKVNEKPKALLFTFVGMNQQEVAYTGQKVIDVILSSDAEALNEVVITGYTTQSKVRQSSSTSKIKAEALDRQVTSRLDQRMEGMSTGLNIHKVNDDSGEEKTELILRGLSTFDQEGGVFNKALAERNSLNKQPLIVVDGFPYLGSINDIDQNTIKSVDILKDAAATALYGLRASNGVVVITTNRGSEGKTRVNFSSNWTFGTRPDVKQMEFASSEDIIAIKSHWMENNEDNMVNDVINYTSPPRPWDPNPKPDFGQKYKELDALQMIWAEFYDNKITAEERDAKLKSLANNDCLSDFEKAFLRGGMIMENSMTMSGGNKSVTYSFTASHLSEKKPIKKDNNQRLNLSLKTNFNITQRLKALVDFNLLSTEKETNGIGLNDLYTGDNAINRYDRLFDDNGNAADVRKIYTPYAKEFADKGFASHNYNPIKDRNYRDNKDKSYVTRIAIGLNYELLKGLSFDVKGQYNRRRYTTRNHKSPELHDTRTFLNRYITEVRTGPGTKVKRAVPYGTIYEMNDRLVIDRVLRAQMNFSKMFEKHSISGIAGLEATESEFTIEQRTRYGYSKRTGLYDTGFGPNKWVDVNGVVPDTHFSNVSFKNNDSFTPLTKTRTVSAYSSLNYSYDARFNLQGTLKVDQGTAFGINKKLAKNYYWSASASWNIHKENWINSEIIDAWKLKASYGTNGNMRPGLTTSTTIAYRSRGYITPQPYASIGSVGNPNLAPEKTFNYNFGTEISLLKRFDLSVDMYHKLSKNLLISLNVPEIYGPLNNMLVNNGEIKNQGIEINLTADILKSTGVKWATSLNFSYNKNEVTKHIKIDTDVASDLFNVIGNGGRLTGEAVSSKVRYRWGGLDEKGDPTVLTKAGKQVAYDSPEFDKLKTEDLITTKPFVAPIYGGITNTFKYKNWTLSALATFKAGHVFEENLEAKFPSTFNNVRTWHKDVAKRWTENNKNTDIPSMKHVNGQAKFKRQSAFIRSDFGIHNAAYIRLKDVTLSYDFNKDLIQKVGLQSASLMFQARNLGLLWTANDKDIDPESVPFSGRAMTYGDNFSSAYRPGIKIPVSFIFGVKVQF